MLNNTKKERGNRILVPLLTNQNATPCCMLKNFAANVAPSNPEVDIFVFSPQNRAEAGSSACRLPYVYYLPLHENLGVKRRGSASDPLLWSGRSHWDGSYRGMGHWRLTFPFAFADALGYKFLWQLDDDSDFAVAQNVSVAQQMKGNLMAGELRTVLNGCDP
jgi:hypothetical protein